MGMSVVIDLGESVWACIDQLSAVSAQAYAGPRRCAGVLDASGDRGWAALAVTRHAAPRWSGRVAGISPVRIPPERTT